MNKKIKILAVAVCTVAFCGTTFAAPPRQHKDDKNDGLRLAAGIVRLVQSVIAPRPVVINQPAPPPQPQVPVVVYQPEPPPQVIYAPPAKPHHEPPRHNGGHRPAPPPKGGRR